MKRLLCQLKGHRWEENASQYGVEYCTRCEREFPHDDWGRNAVAAQTMRDAVVNRLWLLKHRIRFLRARVKWLLTNKPSDWPPF